MEPKQTSEAALEEASPNAWNTVTPLSKYFALTLFVALPFIGGYVGYKYASEKTTGMETLSQVKRDDVRSNQVNEEVFTEDSAPTCFDPIVQIVDRYVLKESDSIANYYFTYDVTARDCDIYIPNYLEMKLYSPSIAGVVIDISNSSPLESFLTSDILSAANSQEKIYTFKLGSNPEATTFEESIEEFVIKKDNTERFVVRVSYEPQQNNSGKDFYATLDSIRYFTGTKRTDENIEIQHIWVEDEPWFDEKSVTESVQLNLPEE